MKLSLERKLALGSSAAAVVLLLVTAASWMNATRYRNTYQSVQHTYEVLSRLEQALTDVLGMQGSARGFVLTGSEEVLQPYTAATAHLQRALDELRDLVVEHPQQRTRLERVVSLADRARNIMAERVAARRARGLDAATETAAYLDGQRAVEEFRTAIREMVAEERRRLDERLELADDAGQRTVLTIAFAGALALALLLIADVVVRRDLAQRRAAEQALRETAAERDRFFTLSRDLLCIANFDGYFVRLNPAWQRIIGFPAEELQSQPFLEFVHPDDRDRTTAEVARLASGAETVDFENRYRCRDGSYRWLRWSARAVPSDRTIYASARDVTERRHAEERIQKLNADLAQRAQELEAANRELESFSYSVSHDLRAPLRHIDGFAGLLAKRVGAALDEEARRYISVISKAAKQMGALIDDLLAFSRIGRTPLRLEHVDHQRLVTGVIADGHYDAPERGIRWEIGSLPDVWADPAMLRQVWANLIDNAVKYSSRSPQSQITIGGHANRAAGEHVFFVRDNGVGFDMAYADKLFGVFQRLHGPSEFEGTGIGLANVHRIVTRHGGRSWAESRVGEGAVFYFSLPMHPPAPDAAI